MPSMRAVLEARRKAAMVRVEQLEAELERVRADLADAEEVLRRRAIGLEQYLEALAEEDQPEIAVGPSQWKPVGPPRVVPHRENAAGLEDLSVDYQAVMAAAAEAGADGLGARRTAVVLGWDSASASRVEGARARLKRLVERGWLVETKPGRFTLPPGRQADEIVRPDGGHKCDHRPADDGFAGVGAALIVPDQASAAQKPGKGPLDDPASGQSLEASDVLAPADEAEVPAGPVGEVAGSRRRPRPASVAGSGPLAAAGGSGRRPGRSPMPV